MMPTDHSVRPLADLVALAHVSERVGPSRSDSPHGASPPDGRGGSFHPLPDGDGTLVRLVHAWDGPRWPLIGVVAATAVIGPVFVHGIASRTLEGLARVAEQHLGLSAGTPPGIDPPSSPSKSTA
jgi:hypothetical protein